MKANVYGRDFRFGKKAKRHLSPQAIGADSYELPAPNAIDEEVEDVETEVVEEMRRTVK